jgi:hypothetical protein
MDEFDSSDEAFEPKILSFDTSPIKQTRRKITYD